VKAKIIVYFCIICIIFTPFIAIAQEDTSNPPMQTAFIDLLKKKEKQLKEKEAVLKKKEEELCSIKAEILDQIKKLTAIKKALESYFARLQTLENKRLDQLAKVYESTPPQQAGKMLEKLDPKLAAKIIMRMNKAKAGVILGYLSPQIACKITEEITKLR